LGEVWSYKGINFLRLFPAWLWFFEKMKSLETELKLKSDFDKLGHPPSPNLKK